MTPRPASICTNPGCPNPATKAGRCPQHHKPAWQGSGGKHGGSNRTYRDKLRPFILARDRYRCVDCGAAGVTLEVDHLDRLADGAPLLAHPSRLQTVCVPCHQRREQTRKAGGVPPAPDAGTSPDRQMRTSPATDL